MLAEGMESGATESMQRLAELLDRHGWISKKQL
jgi:hypothetical protein